ncbi:MAG: FtsX-like permease family protein [Ferruginibacter sp.]
MIKQFLTEAILYSFIAMLVALAMVFILLKPFNEVAGKALVFSSIFNGYTWLFIFALSLLAGLLAGLYPAFYLTSFNPITVLKGMKIFKNSLGNVFVRNGLVVFQFTISDSINHLYSNCI